MCGPHQYDSRFSLSTFLGQVDPWYNSNINGLEASISKLYEMVIVVSMSLQSCYEHYTDMPMLSEKRKKNYENVLINFYTLSEVSQ